MTLRGKLGGVETLLTIRAMTPEEFKRNVEQVRGLLDPVPTPAPVSTQSQPQGPGWCAVHELQMKLNYRDGHSWFSHQTADGWCKGRKGR